MSKLITILGRYNPNLETTARGGTSISRASSTTVTTFDSSIADLYENKMDRGFIEWPDTSTALPFLDYSTIKTTITGNRTFTTTGTPTAGQACWLILCSSGTTPYTIDFSTGFVSDGSISTGSVSGVCKAVAFISAGNPIIEYSRSTGGSFTPTPTPEPSTGSFNISIGVEGSGFVDYLYGTIYLRKESDNSIIDSHSVDNVSYDYWETGTDVSAFVDTSLVAYYNFQAVAADVEWSFDGFNWNSGGSTTAFKENKSVSFVFTNEDPGDGGGPV